MEGWVKLHRVIQEKAVWSGANDFQRVLMIVILLNVNHRANEWEWCGERYVVKPGQMVTSLPSLVKLMGKDATVSKVRSGLARLVKFGFLMDESSNRNRLLTVMNWEDYQGKFSKEKEREEENLLEDFSGEFKKSQKVNRQERMDQVRGGKESHKYVVGELTGNQQASNRLITSNKNDKNEKKGRSIFKMSEPSKELFGDFVKLTMEEYQRLVESYGAAGTRRMIEILDHYKGSSGKKYQSDYRAILSWVVKRWQEEEEKAVGQIRKGAAGLSELERLARGESLEEL